MRPHVVAIIMSDQMIDETKVVASGSTDKPKLYTVSSMSMSHHADGACIKIVVRRSDMQVT